MLGQGLVLRQTVRQSLTVAQRQVAIAAHVLSLRLALVEAIHGVRYEPRAVCPSCNRRLTPLEILKGFNTDVNDFTTECTGCHTRFDPKLVHSSAAGNIEMPFYCDAQTLAHIRGLETLSPEEFQRREPALYHSAVVHRGSLRHAYAQINIAYAFDEVVDAREKVKPFLGRLPDTIIAEVSGLKLSSIRSLRRKLGIRAATEQAMLEEAVS